MIPFRKSRIESPSRRVDERVGASPPILRLFRNLITAPWAIGLLYSVPLKWSPLSRP
jgi:hypothetical protein